MIKVEIYKLSEKEIHMVGDCVGVCWNCASKKKKITGEDGLVYEAVVSTRQGDPYIKFVILREYTDGFYEDEDSPADGGFGQETAKSFAKELTLACKYIDQLKSV